MQTYTLKNGVSEVPPFTMPEDWNEVSVTQYRKLIKAETSEYPDIAIVSALSGIDSEWWKQYEDYAFFITIVDKVSFLAKEADFVGKPNPNFNFKAKDYELPNDAFFGTVAQYEDMKAIALKIQEDTKNGVTDDILDSYSLIARSFLHPIITGEKYDFREIAALKDEYEDELSVVFVMKLGTFFLKRLTAWRVGMKMYSKVTSKTGFFRRILQWVRQALSKLQKTLAFSIGSK